MCEIHQIVTKKVTKKGKKVKSKNNCQSTGIWSFFVFCNFCCNLICQKWKNGFTAFLLSIPGNGSSATG